MTKDEALKIIAEFESKSSDEYATRKEVAKLVTAMSNYLCFEISEIIVRDSFDSLIANMKK